MPARRWLLTILLAGCTWTIGYYMGGNAVPTGQPVSDAAGSGSNLADSAGAMRRAAGTSEDAASAEPIPQALLLSQVRTVLENPSARWGREQLAKLLRSVPLTEIPEFLSQLKDLSRAEREEVGELLLTQWAAERPREAMEYAYRTKTAVGAVMAEWTVADPMSATAWVKALPGGPDRDEVNSHFIPALARRDPQGAFQWIKENEERWQGHIIQVMTHWTRKDLKAAVAEAESLTSGPMANMTAIAVAGSWAETDPAKALEWSLRFADPELRLRAAEAALAEWGRSDPEAALKRVADLPNEFERSSALATLATAMAEKDPDRAAAIVDKLPIGNDRQRAMSSLAYALAEKDPRRAAIYAEQINPEYRSESVRRVLANLLPEDPKAALELALKMDRNPGNQRAVLGTVFDEWMRREPAGALDWLTKNEVPKVSGSEVASAISRWAKENAADARALVQSSSAPAVMNGALQGITEKDPSAAARLALTKGNDDVNEITWQQIGSSWAKRDVAEAAEWLKQLPSNLAQEWATIGVIQSWAERDTTATATWIDRLQPGDLRDHATNAFVMQISRQDPAGALTWARSIQKEGTRDGLMVEVLKTWSDRDLGAAQDWANAQANLPTYVWTNVPQLKLKK